MKAQSRADVRGTHPVPHGEEDEEGARTADTVSSPSRWSESCTEKPGGGIGRCHLGRQDDSGGGGQGGTSTHDAMDGKAGPPRACSTLSPCRGPGRGQEGAGGQGWCCLWALTLVIKCVGQLVPHHHTDATEIKGSVGPWEKAR